ncbi:MAG: NADH-quinone oxidoreductase subunit K [Acidobacteriota bacterium]
MIEYVLCFVLFCVGIYGILAKRNLIKIIVGVVVAETAANLFFVLVAYRSGAFAPILEPNAAAVPMVDPLPHALVLTAIVIGLATTALMAALAMRIYSRYGSYDVEVIRELKG